VADFITLSCPSCGHKLEITLDNDRFACAACGKEYLVEQSGGMITLKPMIRNPAEGMVEKDKMTNQRLDDSLLNEIKTLVNTISVLKQARGSRIRIENRSITFLQVFFVWVFCASVFYLLFRLEANGNDITKLSTIIWLIPAISFIVILILFPLVNKERKEYNRKTVEQNNEIDEIIQQVRQLIDIKKVDLSDL
jgi:ribosomal protein S27E